MKKVVFILGPTGVGKSEMAVELAQKFNAEIISADSVQIFKGLNIGSAKVTKKEMKNVVHHGIDICQPEEEFSVFDFVQFTKQKIDQICARGHLPIVVGGTGLYIKALVLGYNFGGVDKDEKLREELERLADEKGENALFEKLKALDESLAEKTDRFNRVRLVRALEIALAKGQKQTGEVEIESLVLALNRPREKIYEKINSRVDSMVKNGLFEEVEVLKRRGLTKENQSMHAIGYKEILDFFDGQMSKEEAIELIKQHSRNYAKRQLTFLRGMENVNFVDVTDRAKAEAEIEEMIVDFLK